MTVKRILLPVLVCVLACLPIIAASRVAKVDKSDELKADYIFMEAMRQHALDNDDAYYDLLRRAYDLDRRNSEVGFYVGYYTAMIAGNDSALFDDAYALMTRHFNYNPGDFYNSFVYGSISERTGRHDEALKVWAALDSLYPQKTEVTLRLADALSSRSDSASRAKAVSVYNRIENEQGKNIPITTRKIRTYLATQDTAAIVDEVHGLLAASPASPEYNVFAGDIFEMFSQPDSALYYYNRACELDSTSGVAYYARANFYKSVNDSVAYDREIFRALKLESLDLPTKLELLTGYIRDLYEDPAQQPRIQELFATLLEQHPHEVDIHDLYCSYLIAIKDYRGAAEQMGYALDIDPSSEDRWRTVMGLYMNDGDYKRSIDEGEKALHYHPDNAVLYLLMGSDYGQLKDYDKAVEYLEKSLALTDSADLAQRSQVISAIGDVYYSKGDKDRAFEYYDRAIKADPTNTLALNNCAYYLAVEGRDLERAERMSATTLKDDPDNPTSLDTYAWVLFKLKEYVESKVYIDKAIELSDEPSAELYEHAGDIYFMNGEPGEAVSFWKKALELDPESEMLKRKVKHKTYFYQ